MIFTLSEHFDDLDNEIWPQYLPAIENLLIAHASGWHLFVPTRAVVERILDFGILSARYDAMLRYQIGEHLSTLWGQALSARRRIVCVPTGYQVECFEENALIVPLRAFDDLEDCMKSRLVVENANTDGVFYIRLASRLGADGVTQLRLSLDVVHGGGDTTAGRVADAVASARPALVIVDGDRPYPTSPVGSTARHVRENFDASAHSSHVLHVTEVRSAENYIPLILAERAMEGRLESLQMVAALKHVVREEAEAAFDFRSSVVGYMSAKHGIKIGHYRKGCEGFRESVRRLLGNLGIEWVEPANDDSSRDSEQLCRGINARFLETFVDGLDNNEDFGSECEREFPSSPFFDEIQVILKDIAAFGMAAPRIPINLAA